MPHRKQQSSTFSLVILIVVFIVSILGITRLLNPNEKPPKIIKSSNSLYLFETQSENFNAKIGSKENNDPYVVFNSNKKGSVSIKLNKSYTSQISEKNNKITFKDVREGTDFVYTTLQNGIKEEIILSAPQENPEYIFTVTTLDVSPRQSGTDTFTPYFFDDNNDYQFHIDKPFAIDSKGNRTEDVSLSLRKNKDNRNIYELKLVLSSEWLNDKNRSFPVTIDPTILHDTSAEFAAGTLKRIFDTGSGSSPTLETYFHELATDRRTAGLWHLNETAEDSCAGGLDACDSTEFGNHLTNTGSTVSTTNKRLGAASRSFNGTTNYLNSNIAAGSSLDIDSNPVTLEAWIRPNNVTAAQAIIARGTTGVSGYGIRINTTSKVNLGSHGGSNFDGLTTLVVGQWYHVAGVINGAFSQIYINGVLDQTGTVDVVASTGPFRIGADFDATNPVLFFNGIIDEVRVSNKARSPEEIKLSAQRRPYGVYTSPVIDFGAIIPGFNTLSWTERGVSTGDGETVSNATNLVAQWDFNETSGTTANTVASSTSASGGTITDSGGFRYHTFTSDGTFTPAVNQTVDIQVLGGGGGGGAGGNFGGGGGAGQLVTQTSVSVTASTNYAITIGSGGGSATNGNPSSVGTLGITANGGNTGISLVGGTSGNGFTGGNGSNSGTTIGGGGGGGSAGNGGNSTATNVGGTGGAGTAMYDGVTRAGGGGGAGGTTVGAGTAGGGNGGRNAVGFTNGSNATANSGSGGGGAVNATGGTGGSGRVIIRYPYSSACGSLCNGSLTGFTDTTGQDVLPQSGWTSINRRWGAGALSFDGTDDYVNAGTNGSLHTTGNFSVEGWFNTSESGITGAITSFGAASDWLYFFGIQNTDEFLCKIYQANLGAAYIQATSPFDVNDGMWHYAACTISGTVANLYIDGVLVGTSVAPVGSRDVSSAGNLTIGRFNTATPGYYKGQIDSVRIYSRALTSDEIVSNYNNNLIDFQTRSGSDNTPEDNWEEWKPVTSETTIENFDQPTTGLVSYWPMSETSGVNVEDTAGANDGTATNTTITEGILGKSRVFNGSSYITVNDDATLDITGDFTLMAWVYRTGGGNGYIITKFGPSGGGGYAILHGGSGEVYCRTDNGTSFTDSYTKIGKVTTTSGWVHVAAVKTGTSCRVFINGEDVTNTANTHSSNAANSQPLKIGAAADDNSSPFSGIIDDARVFNVALTQSQIHNLIGAGTTSLNTLTPYSNSSFRYSGTHSFKSITGSLILDLNTAALYHLDETGATGAYVKDSSNNSNNGTPTGTSTVAGITGKGRSFNGTSDIITVTNNSSLNFGSGNFTLEAWIKTNTTSRRTIISKLQTPGPPERGYLLDVLATGLLRVVAETDTGNLIYVDSTIAVNDSKWHHVAGVRNGANVSVYIDGVNRSGGQTTTGTVSTTDNSLNLTIGAPSFAGSTYWIGQIDEVRISNSARTANEIAETYRLGRDHYLNRYIPTTDLTSKKSIPFYIASDRPGTIFNATIGDSPFANSQPDISTVALYHLDEETGTGAFIADATNTYPGTPTNSPGFVTGKVGGARTFDGAANYISLTGINSALNISTYTYSAWVYPTVLDGVTTRTVLDNRDAASDGTIMYITGANQFNCQHNGINSTSTETLLIKRWYHIACVSNGSSLKLYVNGVLKANSAIATPVAITTDAKIGTRNFSTTANFFAGHIDELRIDNVARSAADIRNLYDQESRSHQISIDFTAGLVGTGLIADSSDLNFTVNAQDFGLSQKGEKIYTGEKIIVREIIDDVEYMAQGIVNSVNISTGDITVVSWDNTSTFPTGGYTSGAVVFKWQREYWPIITPLDSQLSSSKLISLRVLGGNEGKNVWIDDLSSVTDYLTDPAGSNILSTAGVRYFQYRYFGQNPDQNISATVSAVTVDYDQNTSPIIPTLDFPADGSISAPLLATLKTTTTDAENDYIQYKITICTDVAMTTNCQTFDQSVSQTGWSGQNTQSNTAYTSGTQATYTLQSPLVKNTTYYWKSSGIDPAGSNSFGSTQATPFSFTTNASPSIPALDSPADTATGINFLPQLQTTTTDIDSDYIQYKIELCTDLAMTTNCQTFDQSASQTGWSGQNTQSNTAYTSGTQATYTIQNPLTINTTYYWRSYGIDPAGSNSFGSTQATPFSFTTNAPPNIPSLDSPTNTATGVLLNGPLKTTVTDPNGDFVRYKIELCTNVGMSSNCQTFDQTISQTGWSGQNTQSNTAYTSGTQATYTLQVPLIKNTTYYWRSYAIDPSGSNSFGSTQASPYSFTTNNSPNTPSFVSPADGASGISTTAVLQTAGTDPDSDYLRYKIEICTNITMSTGCQTFDQTISQTGWSGQNAQSNTAYTSGTTATYTTTTPLNALTTYYWRSYSIDPGGTNTFSSTQTPISFITLPGPAAPSSCTVEKNTANTQITINWVDNSVTEDGYQVWRVFNGGAPTQIGTNLAPNITSYLDTNVSNGNSYGYLVRAFQVDGGTTLYSAFCATATSNLSEGNFRFEGIQFN